MTSEQSFDVVIIGGAMMGSSLAWWLSDMGFGGRVAVIERDPSYEFSSTARTNSCIRQQFSSEINIRISQFGAEFIHGFHERIGDPEAPQLKIQSFGYMYLAGSEKAAAALRTSHAAQVACGAATRLMTPDEIGAEYPFYNLEGVVLGSHNPVDEGYFDGATIFDWWRKIAKRRGVSYLTGEVTGLTRAGNRITGVTLADGTRIACGMVVNAAGPRAATIAGMAGLEIPIEPRRRYTYIFDAAEPLGQDLPLTIDPSGVHMRTDGRYYLCGCPPFHDHAMAFDDFSEEPGIWEEKLWPALAHRVPAFERIKVIRSWVGHYAY
ncbi:MAG: FAD-dependent oxidoreductase, partial [Pseudomonadota bacterium]